MSSYQKQWQKRFERQFAVPSFDDVVIVPTPSEDGKVNFLVSK